MSDLFGVAASAAGGGVFGVLGTALGRFASFFESRQANAHEKDRWVHEAKLLELQMKAREVETEAEVLLAETAGSWDGLKASMQAEAAIGASYRWVDAIRGLTRPTLTVLLWLIAGVFFFFPAQESDRTAIIEAATFAATGATLWWFGDRGALRNPRP